MLYFLVFFVFLGFILPRILEEVVPGVDPSETFNGLLIYMVILVLLMRFLFQPLSTINLQSYQVRCV